MQKNERTTIAGNRVGNKILLSISDKGYALIRSHLESLIMPHHLSLYEPGQPLEFVHFPNAGMVSLVIATADGRTVVICGYLDRLFGNPRIERHLKKYHPDILGSISSLLTEPKAGKSRKPEEPVKLKEFNQRLD